MTTKNHAIADIEKYFLLGALVALVITLFLFASPFLITLFLAAIVVTAIHPVHVFINKKLYVTESLSALLTLLFVTTIILGPCLFVFFAIAGEAKDAYLAINQQIQILINSDYNFLSLLDSYPTLQGWGENFLSTTPFVPDKILSVAGNFVGSTSKLVLSQATNIFRNLTMFVLHTIIFLGGVFFFIRDGEKLVGYLRSLLPLRKKHRQQVLDGMYRFTHSIIYGIFGAAVAQAVLLWVALALIGFSHAVFWSAIGAFLALFPVGIALVWVPIAIGLFVSGQTAPAIFFTAWCVGVVSLADNFVKPYVIGVKSMLHPFAVIVMILGGFFAFGFKGAIFGPFIFMLATTFLRIYKEEYQEILEEKE